MCAPPPVKPIQAVISRLVPQATVQQVQVMPPVHCQRVYGVKVSNGTSLVLVVPPPPMVRLLRSERASVISEAAVLKWLAGKTVEQPLLQEPTPEPDDLLEISSDLVRWVKGAGSPIDDAAKELCALLPTLITHTAATNELGLEYNLLRPTQGIPISELNPPLSPSERRTIDFQTGQLYRQLCKHVSPTGRFGPAFAVLPSVAPPSTADPTKPARRDVNARLLESRGVQSWAMAFHSMLEAVLRDGEDMQVMLGYGTIRRHFKRFEHTLNGIKTPRLVAVDVGKDINTLALRRSRRRGTPSLAQGNTRFPLRDPLRGNGGDEESEEGPGQEVESESEDAATLTACHQNEVFMAGMKDWSNFIFGDPLFALNFGRDPSSEFLAGFGGDGRVQGTTKSVFSSDMVEDKERAHIRLLLYDCYHTVTHIARGYFRPQKDSHGRELEARKRLNTILAQLDALDDNGIRRGRRSSGELSPAKRSKSGAEDD
ncbi:hypothetical protein CH063_03557 [Colletotrichum higginsianum]|uniref:Uncharacterized protein n=2 Tax=Colletotrichum higginsianum TaxID=80884 RepID=H1VYF1_COLHI|nr:hypothetical protein CH63R_01144 [Colletotrichum higginsianum IMI 349063]OBR15964.1 hypothetical protein CH63R_01144 [Colletotrichum higginsianum IMI 349063]CCF45263.1 hypothetical protein CH063_03557 [Colletotrichum higginsianum]